MKTILVLFLILFFGGCLSMEERAQRAIALYGPYCQKLGYQAQTDGWRDCILRMASDEGRAQNALIMGGLHGAR